MVRTPKAWCWREAKCGPRAPEGLPTSDHASRARDQWPRRRRHHNVIVDL